MEVDYLLKKTKTKIVFKEFEICTQAIPELEV